MSFCQNPDRTLERSKHFRNRKTTRGSGKNSGSRHRGAPFMETKMIDWITDPSKLHLTLAGDCEITESPKEMWDTHGYIQQENPCTKEKLDFGAEPIPTIKDFDGSVIVDFNTTTPAIRGLIRSIVPQCSFDFLDELALKSEEKLTNVVQSETSIFNFLLELYQTVTGNISKIQKYASIYTRMIRLYFLKLKELLKRGIKFGAAQWLSWNFAIKPGLKDLRNILCSIDKAYKTLAWLKNHNHKVVHRHYERSDLLSEFWDGSPIENAMTLCHVTSNISDSADGLYRQRVTIDDVKVEYAAHAKLFLDIPEYFLDGLYGIGVLWGSLMGLHNPIGIIWEATPFSWLIDYFLSYRARIFERINDYSPYNEGVTVLGMSHSFSFTLLGTVDVIKTFNGVTTTYKKRGRFIYTLYSRVPGLPFHEETSLFRVPASWYKFSILAAIAVGFNRRR